MEMKVEESWEAVLIDAGQYDVKVVGIVPKTLETDKDGTVNILEWKIEVLEGDESGTVITDASSQKFTPKSKAFEWYCNITGTKPEVGESVDLDTLVGKTASVIIKSKSKTIMDEKQEVSVISDFVPARKPRAGTKPAK